MSGTERDSTDEYRKVLWILPDCVRLNCARHKSVRKSCILGECGHSGGREENSSSAGGCPKRIEGWLKKKIVTSLYGGEHMERQTADSGVTHFFRQVRAYCQLEISTDLKNILNFLTN